jgi:hypothetical protein
MHRGTHCIHLFGKIAAAPATPQMQPQPETFAQRKPWPASATITT